MLTKHIAAGAFFVSNFTLWNESGYFDIAASQKVLLHLWSLAIEEQFYIVWPGLSLLGLSDHRAAGGRSPIVGIFVISFPLSAYLTHTDQVAAFFWAIVPRVGIFGRCVNTLLFRAQMR